tara:strand:- start:152 stop:652 length:501 start_codon:yes stop_codon:yes gene_type:complete
MAAQRSSFETGQMTLRENVQEFTPRTTSEKTGWTHQSDRACFSGAQAAAAITGDDRTRELTDLPGAAGSSSRLAARQAAAGKLRSHCFSEPIYFAQAPYSGPHSLSEAGGRALHGSLAGDGVMLGPRGSPMAGEEFATEKKGCLHSPIRRAATEGHTVKELLTSSP